MFTVPAIGLFQSTAAQYGLPAIGGIHIMDGFGYQGFGDSYANQETRMKKPLMALINQTQVLILGY